MVDREQDIKKNFTIDSAYLSQKKKSPRVDGPRKNFFALFLLLLFFLFFLSFL